MTVVVAGREKAMQASRSDYLDTQAEKQSSACLDESLSRKMSLDWRQIDRLAAGQTAHILAAGASEEIETPKPLAKQHETPCTASSTSQQVVGERQRAISHRSTVQASTGFHCFASTICSRMEEDPATQLFGDSEDGIDLYGALNLNKSDAPTVDAIKKAYRRLALAYHPDKQAATLSEAERAEATLQFQRIGYAYAVLSDETRKARYDATGRTDQGGIEDLKGDASWEDYFKTLWSGEVNADTIDDFFASYEGSSSLLFIACS